MGTTGRKWIEQWLSGVSPEGLEGDKVHDSGHKNTVMPNEDSQLLHAMPKPRSATLAPLQTRHAKRMRDQLDEIETPIVNTHNKKPRGYDKQPRRRTREDRYEYHAPDITGGRIHRDRKPSKVRRGRKGTINDRFRASNVARSRLTLPSLAALGIFNKGKSSSPMQIRHDQYHHARNERGPTNVCDVASKVQTLACSVTNLSGSEKVTTTNRIKLDQLGTHRFHSHGQKWLGPSFEKELMLRTDQVNRRPIKSIDTNDRGCVMTVKSSELRELSSHAIPFAGVNHPGDCGQQNHLPENQDASPSGAMSATPYVLLESNTSRPQPKHALEEILLAEAPDKLCVGTNTQNESIDTTRRYYELIDLQELLANRKAMWGEDAGGNSLITCSSSGLISRHAYTESTLSKGQKIGARKISNMNTEDLVVKDLLFQQLDKLFQEIVEGEDGKFHLEGEQLDILPTKRQLLHEPRTEFDTQCLQHTNETQCDCPHLISYNRSWLTDDTSASFRGILPIVHAEPLLEKRAICNDNDFRKSRLNDIFDGQFLSREPCLTEDHNSQFAARAPPAPHCSHAFPLGFWRQNKLY